MVKRDGECEWGYRTGERTLPCQRAFSNRKPHYVHEWRREMQGGGLMVVQWREDSLGAVREEA